VSLYECVCGTVVVTVDCCCCYFFCCLELLGWCWCCTIVVDCFFCCLVLGLGLIGGNAVGFGDGFGGGVGLGDGLGLGNGFGFSGFGDFEGLCEGVEVFGRDGQGFESLLVGQWRDAFEICWLGRGEMYPSGLRDTKSGWWAESSVSLRVVGGQRVSVCFCSILVCFVRVV